MQLRLCLVVALLSCCEGGASEDSASGKILAFAGETVILPCRIDVSGDLPTLEWYKEGSDHIIALLYRHGCETHEMKDPVFRYRTSLIMNELQNGNISLRISTLRLSDAGKYVCMTRGLTSQKVVTVELVLGAVSEPKLSVLSAVGGGVTVQCKATCWYPKPEIKFLDDQEKDVGAEDPEVDPDSSGCFTVTRKATVQTHANRISCRVHQPEINQMKSTEIYIPESCMMSCTQNIVIAVVVTIILSAIFAFVCRKGYEYVRRKLNNQMPTKLPVSMQSPNRSSGGGNGEGDAGNPTAELQRELNDLNVSLHDKDELIRQQREELNQLRSKQSPVVCQHGRPTIGGGPSRPSPEAPSQQLPRDSDPRPAAPVDCRPKSGSLSDKLVQSGHNHSSPALLTDDTAASAGSSSPSTSEGGHIFRSMSLSEPRPHPTNSRPQRRNTTSVLSRNRLENLPEDSEPLLP